MASRAIPSSSALLDKVFIALLVLITVVRVSFLGSGAMTFPDEQRYYSSVAAIKDLFPLSHGGLGYFNAHIAETQGRPGDAVLRTVPASLQVLLDKATDLSPREPDSLVIPQVFNYFIILASLYFFYRIARLLLRHQSAALLSTLVYACLVNTNVYIRHILPYDPALLCIFYGFYLILRRREQPTRPWSLRGLIGLGALMGLSFTVYPGYNPAVVVAWLLLLERRVLTHFDWRSGLRTSVAYGVGVLLVLGAFQGLSLLNGTNYYEDCVLLAGSVRQGDYADGLAFLPKYLRDAERSLGYLLLGLAALAGPVLLFRVFRQRVSLARLGYLLSDNLLVVTMMLALLRYAVAVYYQEKMVFYGRILHLYLPFVVLLLARVLYPATRRQLQVVLAAGVAAVALYSFTVFTLEYHRIVYPVTFLHRQAPALKNANVSFRDQAADASGADYYSVINACRERPIVPGQPQLVLTNMKYLYYIHGEDWCNEIHLPSSYKLTFSAPHFLTMPAYPFEGYTMAERDAIDHCQYQCQVYEQK